MNGGAPFVLGLIAVSVLFGGCDIQAQAGAAEGTFERTLQVGGSPEVHVSGRSGSIRVAPGGEGTVQVRARIRAHDAVDLFSPYTAAERVAKLQNDPPIVQRRDSIVIGDVDEWGLLQNVSITYEITVPTNTRLTTESRSATQTITSIGGPVAASSRSGSISIEGAGGALRLESRSGDVTIAGEPRENWEVQTRSGEVELRIPQSAGFDLSIASRSGAIETRRALSPSSRLRHNRLDARVGAGGPRVDIATRSGSIRIE
jgi:hypothetical protein